MVSIAPVPTRTLCMQSTLDYGRRLYLARSGRPGRVVAGRSADEHCANELLQSTPAIDRGKESGGGEFLG